jgi:hypothetical protein
MAKDRDGFNSNGVEFRGGFFRGEKMKNMSYKLGSAIMRSGFGASKPLRDFDKQDKLFKQRSYKDVGEYGVNTQAALVLEKQNHAKVPLQQKSNKWNSQTFLMRRNGASVKVQRMQPPRNWWLRSPISAPLLAY